jgi:hypothetical protein
MHNPKPRPVALVAGRAKENIHFLIPKMNKNKK